MHRVLGTTLAFVAASNNNWTKHAQSNCYNDHGGTDMEVPTGSNCGAMSISACEAKCLATAGCTAITYNNDVSQCYRRSAIELSKCTYYKQYDTYTLATPPPPTPALPTPASNSTWVKDANKNCYTGNGGKDLENPPGSSCGQIPLTTCEAKCLSMEACTAFTYKASSKDCYRRADVNLQQCSSDSAYDTYTLPPGPRPPAPPTPAPPPSGYLLNYDGNNPLQILGDQNRSKNYFIILGDWGKSGGPGPCQAAVAQKMKAFATKQKAAGMTLLFIAVVGDNFYWHGVDPKVSWDLSWSKPYGTTDASSPLYHVPWLAVMGNHDYGDTDAYAFCPGKQPLATINGQAYASFQLNADRNPTRPNNTMHYWLPDLDYHYEIPELSLEVIAIDKNSVDIGGLGGDASGHAKSMAACGGSAVVTKFLTDVTHAGLDLMERRAKNGTATTVLIIQHYPGECSKDVFENALPASRKGRVNVICAYGHTHDQQCNGQDKNGNCNMVMTGGGGGCCGPQINLGGFTSVALDDAGGFVTDVTSDDVRMKSGSCTWTADGDVFWLQPPWRDFL